MICHSCSKEVPVAGKPSRADLCPGCGSALRACLNCHFWDEKAHHQCREPQTEWVRDKAAANFCDEFIPSNRGAKAANPKADEARRKLDALFGGGGGT